MIGSFNVAKSACVVARHERIVRLRITLITSCVFLSVHKEFARKLLELERRVAGHDEDIKTLIKAIKQLIHPSVKPKKQIGFKKTD